MGASQQPLQHSVPVPPLALKVTIKDEVSSALPPPAQGEAEGGVVTPLAKGVTGVHIE